jgi:signal transduction histidine kinase
MIEIAQKIREETDRLFLSRTRIVAGIVIASILASVVSDLALGEYPEHPERALVSVLGVLAMSGLFYATYHSGRIVSPRVLGFAGTLGVYVFMFALSFDTGPQAETVSVLSFPMITLGAAILMPWGAWLQVALVCVAFFTLVLNLYLLPGDLVVFDASLGVALTNALWLSVFIAATLERNRLTMLRQSYELAEQRDLAERQRAHAEALAQDLDAYARAVAHDLKNPVGVIAGYSDLLATSLEGRLNDEEQQFLAWTADGCAKMTQIIDELLLLASVRKTGSVAVEPLDMSKIVGEASRRLAGTIEESGADIVAPDQWPRAVGHTAWVEEVWVNYISNAIKYGGVPPRVELGADRDGDGKIHFWVRDNGQGLNEEQLGRLFEEFSRIEPSKAQGHGLGLSIVKRIVEKLGGEVRVTSMIAGGSRFGFTLPERCTENRQSGST